MCIANVICEQLAHMSSPYDDLPFYNITVRKCNVDYLAMMCFVVFFFFRWYCGWQLTCNGALPPPAGLGLGTV